MIKLKNIVGKKPKFMILDRIESTDIDDEVDFFFLPKLYIRKYLGKNSNESNKFF